MGITWKHELLIYKIAINQTYGFYANLYVGYGLPNLDFYIALMDKIF